MKKVTPKNNNAQSTYITLKECCRSEIYQKALERMQNSQKKLLKLY